jgi:hypothetical protein
MDRKSDSTQRDRVRLTRVDAAGPTAERMASRHEGPFFAPCADDRARERTRGSRLAVAGAPAELLQKVSPVPRGGCVLAGFEGRASGHLQCLRMCLVLGQRAVRARAASSAGRRRDRAPGPSSASSRSARCGASLSARTTCTGSGGRRRTSRDRSSSPAAASGRRGAQPRERSIASRQCADDRKAALSSREFTPAWRALACTNSVSWADPHERCIRRAG